MYEINDTLTLDIPVRFQGTDYEAKPPVQCEFYICPKTRMKAAQDTHEHFKNMLTQVKADHLPIPKPPTSKKEQKEFLKSDHLVVLAECEEVANQLIDKTIGDCLKNHGQKVNLELHITDQKVYYKYPMFMRVKMNIGQTAEEQESVLKVIKAIYMMLDKIPKLKISESAKRKAASARKVVDSEKVKEENDKREEEQLEKKRREQLEYNEKLKQLTPE